MTKLPKFNRDRLRVVDTISRSIERSGASLRALQLTALLRTVALCESTSDLDEIRDVFHKIA